MFFEGHKKYCAFLLVMTLTGCAGISSRSPEERVLARSQERLDLLMGREVEAAFGYATDGYRASHSLAQYDKKFGGAKTLWLDARATEASCDGVGTEINRCKVLVEVDYTTRYMGYLETAELNEIWLLSDGEWFIYLE